MIEGATVSNGDFAARQLIISVSTDEERKQSTGERNLVRDASVSQKIGGVSTCLFLLMPIIHCKRGVVTSPKADQGSRKCKLLWSHCQTFIAIAVTLTPKV